MVHWCLETLEPEKDVAACADDILEVTAEASEVNRIQASQDSAEVTILQPTCPSLPCAMRPGEHIRAVVGIDDGTEVALANLRPQIDKRPIVALHSLQLQYTDSMVGCRMIRLKMS